MGHPRSQSIKIIGARIYTRPEEPPKVYVSGFGPEAARLAGAIGDGYVSTRPDADLVHPFHDGGGAGKPSVAGAKGCWAPTDEEGLAIAHRLWPTEQLPGELAQVLPTPEHFEQASSLVTPDMMIMPHGPDPKPYLDMINAYEEAGFDELHIAAVGPYYRELIGMLATEVLPAMADR